MEAFNFLRHLQFTTTSIAKCYNRLQQQSPTLKSKLTVIYEKSNSFQFLMLMSLGQYEKHISSSKWTNMQGRGSESQTNGELGRANLTTATRIT
jgi:hypothetical protein